MHQSAFDNCKWFYDHYVAGQNGKSLKIADIGSLDINGSLKSIFPENHDYKGVDFSPGKNVDIVIQDPYKLPFADDTLDLVVSSSCFEHSDMFWLVFNEIMRILKPDGLFYLNVPSNGIFHRHPVDSWRFYPDSGHSLVRWARRSGYSTVLLESYISRQLVDKDDGSGFFWNDFVGIFLKNESFVDNYPNRITNKNNNFTNGYIYGVDQTKNFSMMSEDLLKINVAKKILQGALRVNP